MPITPTFPGVYIEEIPSGVRTITGVATSITAFIGRALRGPVNEPITINSNGIYDALKTGRVDAQENPLALLELFKLYEVVTYVSMTNHMWSGFNLLAHRPTWTRLPDDIKAVITRNVMKHVRLQRRDQQIMHPRSLGNGNLLAFQLGDAFKR